MHTFAANRGQAGRHGSPRCMYKVSRQISRVLSYRHLHQDMKRPPLCIPGLTKLPDGRQGGDIEFSHLHLCVRNFFENVCLDALSLGHVPGRYHHRGSSQSQHSGCLHPDASSGPCIHPSDVQWNQINVDSESEQIKSLDWRPWLQEREIAFMNSN